MAYQLPPDLSFCLVDNHVVLLDLAKDRYFRLPERLEHAFIAHLLGRVTHDNDLHRLLGMGVLVECGPGPGQPIRVASAEPPMRSLLEGRTPATRVPITVQLHVSAIVAKTQLALKFGVLNDILRTMAHNRDRRCPMDDRKDSIRLREASSTFNRARLSVPLGTCCLLDSLSLLRYLATRHLFARLVIGVTGEPFSAHCWVQAGDLVLNDTVGNAGAHIPIRVI